MTATSNNLKLAFAHGEDALDVRHFSIHEGMSELFEVSVLAISDDANIDIDDLVGQGAALTMVMPNYQALHKKRVWTGVVAHASQVHAEEHPGQSMYHVMIVPDFWRTTLRRNSRIYQHKDVPTIVKEMLLEWGITPDTSNLKAKYPQLEYCVQYGETDFAFISRLLEEAGITYFFKHDGTSGTGTSITILMLSDTPTDKANERGGVLAYAGHQTPAFGRDKDFCSTVLVTQRMKPGKFTVRDFNFRTPLLKSYQTVPSGKADEDKYEQYDYVPGAYWIDTKRIEKPVADGGTGPNNDEPGAGKDFVQHGMEGERRRRLQVAFNTNATDLAPGKIIGINQESDSKDHPRKDLAPAKKILLIETTLEGEATGEWTMTCSGVFAEFPYRPERRTPKPRIYGVQSAFVVGPAGQEVYTDEYGRVRVQFHWDREGKYDEKSSCWMRVSQGWAGGSFGMVNLPRVGHEVMVEFFEGDPDRPIVTGRAHNETSPVTWTLPEQQTKSGWRTNTLPSSAKLGYNEMVFEDAAANELIHFQAESLLSYVVKDSESASIGKGRSVTIGGPDKNGQPVGLDTLDVGKTVSLNVGKTYVIGVGKQYLLSLGQTTGILITDKRIAMTTGQASVTLNGTSINIMALGSIICNAGGAVEITSQSNPILIQGGETVHFNPVGSGPAPTPVPVPPAHPPAPPDGGPVGTPPVIPSGRTPVDPPGPIEDATLGGPPPPKPSAGGGSADSRDSKAGTPPAAPPPAAKDAVTDLGGGMKAKGTPGFVSAVKDRLTTIGKTTTGKALLGDIAASGHTVTFEETGDDNSYCSPVDPVAAGGKGKPTSVDGVVGTGKGSDSTLELNPNFTMPNPAGKPEPNDGVLFHELVHADDNARGQRDRTLDPVWGNLAEKHALTAENGYLKEIGYGFHNINHEGGWAPDAPPPAPVKKP